MVVPLIWSYIRLKREGCMFKACLAHMPRPWLEGIKSCKLLRGRGFKFSPLGKG